jgi:Holliday junction resolvase RusA-like endonuclease
VSKCEVASRHGFFAAASERSLRRNPSKSMKGRLAAQTVIEASIADSPKARRGRKPHISTTIELPIPPSVNGLWFNAPGRGRMRTDEYRAWLNEAGWLLKEQRVVRIHGTAGMELRVGLSNRRRDVDNVIKPFGDLLQANGVIRNDQDIVEVSAKVGKDGPPWLRASQAPPGPRAREAYERGGSASGWHPGA